MIQLEKNINTDVSKNRRTFIFRMKQSQKSEILKLLKFGDEKKIDSSYRKYLPVTAAKPTRTLETKGKIKLSTLHIDLSRVIVKK